MSAISGQKTVTTAGTAVALGTLQVNGPLAVKALPGNTGVIYIGNDGAGDVSSSNGFPLSAGDPIVFESVDSLADIFIDATVNGEGVGWHRLDL